MKQPEMIDYLHVCRKIEKIYRNQEQRYFLVCNMLIIIQNFVY